jgi:general secretion pathway protein F
VPTFRYTAVDRGGKVVRGALEAASEAMVADQLHGKGGLLLSASRVGGKEGAFAFLHADLAISRGPPKAAIAYFTRELSVMLSAGQDIDHALRFLVESSEDKRMRPILESLRNQVRGGKSLAAALGEHSRVFSRLYISLVRAGEAGGKLADGLASLADLLERESRLAATVQSAMTYPALLIIASVGTVVMLLTYVLPQFTPIFEQAGAKLPRPTRILIGLGDFVREDGFLMLAAIILAGFAVYRAMQSPGPRIRIERIALRLPIVGPLTRRAQAARFMRTIGTLLRNGVSLVSALAIGRGVLKNLIAAQTVDRAATDVKSGRRLAASLAAGHFFPLQTIHLIELGEETGRLAEMSVRAADIHDEQVAQSVQRLVSILVPVITIVMGVVVAGIVGSLLVAMLSLNDLAL